MLKFVLVVAVFALAFYLTIRVIERRGLQGGGGRGEGPGTRPAPPRPLGPDDDPDFLWQLDRRKRHPEKGTDDGPETTPPPETP
ncbi:hypothetical protein [Nocardioides pacificus]